MSTQQPTTKQRTTTGLFQQLAQIVASVQPEQVDGMTSERIKAQPQPPLATRFAVKPPKPPYGTRRSMGKR